jgi:hypothetical protein
MADYEVKNNCVSEIRSVLESFHNPCTCGPIGTRLKGILLYINTHCGYNLPVCMKLAPGFCQILYRGFWLKFVIMSVLLKTTEISHFYMKTDIHLYKLSCCLNWTNIYVVEVCTCVFSYISPHFVKWGQPTKHQFHRRSKKQILKKLPS